MCVQHVSKGVNILFYVACCMILSVAWISIIFARWSCKRYMTTWCITTICTSSSLCILKHNIYPMCHTHSITLKSILSYYTSDKLEIYQYLSIYRNCIIKPTLYTPYNQFYNVNTCFMQHLRFHVSSRAGAASPTTRARSRIRTAWPRKTQHLNGNRGKFM